MKKIICLLLIVNGFCRTNGQNAESLSMLDTNMQVVAQEKAVYLVHKVKINEGSWQIDKYRMHGPMISSSQFKDELGKQANGRFSYYNKKGKLDSTGNYLNGLQEGDWNFINDTGRYFLQKKYKAGKLLSTIDLIKKDSVAKLTADTTGKNPDETEADFIGGQGRWIYYLGKNTKYPQDAQKAGIQGTVSVQFWIDEEGNTEMPEMFQSVEYSLDQEAIRLVLQSPTWKPGLRAGKPVKNFKRQPMTFKLEAQ